MVEQILKREEIWINWKSKNCPTFIRNQVAVGEKRKFEEIEGGISMDGDVPVTTVAPVLSVDVMEVMRTNRSHFHFDYSDSNVKEISKCLADSCPVLDNLVEVRTTLCTCLSLYSEVFRGLWWIGILGGRGSRCWNRRRIPPKE